LLRCHADLRLGKFVAEIDQYDRVEEQVKCIE